MKSSNLKKNIHDFSLWTALITPLTENDTLDVKSLQVLLKEQAAAHNGLLLLGSTGEALNLNLDEKKTILKIALEQNFPVPIMVGVSGHNIQESSAWMRYLETLDVDCYLMPTPIYAKPGEEGQYQWFKTLMDLSSRPVMLYNIPGRAGIALNHNTAKRLAKHPNAWAIKEASGSNLEFSRYREDAPQLKIFSGDDGMLPGHASLGAAGLISVASNVWPAETNLYTKMSLELKITPETVEGKMWQKASDSLFTASNPIPAKAILHRLGRISSNKMRLPLSALDLKSTELLEESDREIRKWFTK
ncbi:MAG: 4-hydroxy-tetrahydrodipicolinate synthase [Bdellovibrionales bacterium RIFOXYD12_FULL_39_22]|nr:MAG: 4-hydroxy-tetrahydrodipicolinate synthase [Bdellovibrionales bacterium RIFOXYB1_FULL_39_21]OFZ41150.1 MAG: 4-hydroxy-tetrahydrodipicolinate synthase [Bdellovibrionales bacterium RIFOXYC12_FULL_39_17]OFZ44904.1 MAG: 4-hydroxy-tetrahydrodipicolinate synthase [Bdellovibrionales bacterium RIFOXYC1_FULL_39_130]OFZ74351.1 MAG: 4-hydroxy-tetrahydrodipicolinate synthase [Bdellovibrionales bacterium RIFOXYD1_FULL_39_84]OFZ74665.1 MAG: 4-hydroxy-tetrahydrodipicolinate synthase [Bdellovibrionales 